MRARLIYNPAATTTSPRVRDAIAWRLSRRLALDLSPTARRGHASTLAAEAAAEGIELVITLGGDGTVNEVLQGLAGTASALAVLPGGSTNVWARNLGVPADAEQAADRLLALLDAGQRRRVTLGLADGRYFAFAAGFGFDAAVVREVERRGTLKRTVRQGAFLWAALRTLATRSGHRDAAITVELDGQPCAEPAAAAIVCNCRPYTYLARWPVQLCPQADLEQGLALTTLSSLSLPHLLRTARAALGSGDVGDVPGVTLHPPVERLVLSHASPLPLQLDGDDVGDVHRVELRAAHAAVELIA